MTLALALLACGGSGTLHGPVAEVEPEAPDPVVSTEEVAGLADPSAWLFDESVIHEIAITLPASSVAALDADPWSYAAGDVVVDGIEVDDVGVRLRGLYGSFRYLSGKPKLRVDFSYQHQGREFYGLGALTLNNAIVDCSYMKEATAYRVFRDLGVPAPRTAWAHVTVNEADYGLYVLIETEDDRFLDRSWPDGSGNLYDGKYRLWEDWSYTLLDFDRSVADLYELEEGADVGHTDIYGVVDAIDAGWGRPGWEPRTAEAVDWDAVHRMLLGEQWVGHVDGYAMNTNNYRVYFDPADGKAELVPYDLDYAFIRDWEWGMSWSSPRGRLAAGCWADPACADRHREIAADALQDVDTDALLAWYDASFERIRGAAYADPRKECAPYQIAEYRDGVRAWVTTASDETASFWGVE